MKLSVVLTSLFAIGWPLLMSVAAAADKPNVILVLADDLGFGDLGCHGNPHVKTPQIDALSRDGVEFANFYVTPICHSTRAALLTGRYHQRTFRDVSFHMDPAEVTVAEALRASGYKTALFGKWHLGDGPEECPNAQGFDETVTFPQGSLKKLSQMFDPELLHNGKSRKYPGYCMDVFTNEAIAFIKQNRDRPFFVYLPAPLIHTPLAAPKELKAKYSDLDGELPTLYGMIDSLDTNVGRLRTTVKELGIEDKTLLIFLSDNGPSIHSRNEVERSAGLHGPKGTIYEGGIRVPCFMRWPAGFQRQAKLNQRAAHIDMMPTILEVCGVAAPGGVNMDGRSLLPLARDTSPAWAQRTLFIQFDSNGVPTREHSFAAMTQRWKLVQPCGDFVSQPGVNKLYSQLGAAQGRGRMSIAGKKPRFELYDLDSDPQEMKDLAAQQPQLVEDLRKQYNAWFDDIEATARWRSNGQSQ